MFGTHIALTSYYFATTYGESAFGSDTYNGQATGSPATPPTQTTAPAAPGAPNTGFFTSVMTGSNEFLLIPIILALAVVIGALSLGIKKLVRTRKA